jgi:hypothetical protein
VTAGASRAPSRLATIPPNPVYRRRGGDKKSQPPIRFLFPRI